MDSDATIDSQQTAVEGIIADVSERVQSYLNRDLIEHTVTQRIYRNAWEEEPIDDTWIAWARDWPLISIDTSGYSIYDDRRIQGDRDDVKITYDAGYAPTSGSMTADPLPADITNVCLRVVLFEVSETGDDMLGLGQREQAIGNGNQLTVRGRDSGFVMRELHKLDRYKRRIAL